MRQHRATVRGMSRRMPLAQSLFGPGACCDACARPKWDMGGEGSLCYWCHAGVFMHRRFWRFTFDGEEFVCATPRDNVDAQTVRDEWLALAAQLVKDHVPVPAPLAAAIAGSDPVGQASGCTSSGPLLRGEPTARLTG